MYLFLLDFKLKGSPPYRIAEKTAFVKPLRAKKHFFLEKNSLSFDKTPKIS